MKNYTYSITLIGILLLRILVPRPSFAENPKLKSEQELTNPSSSISSEAPVELYIKGVPVEVPLKEFSSSAVVIGKKEIEESGSDHFQNVMDVVPNLNWAGGTSRPRFFQIRGVGELEQYEGAPNPSVGVLVDDIDFSGIGGITTLYDVDQVEVLRGPQSIRYGANALAGIIHVHSADPTAKTTVKGEVSGGTDDLIEGGLTFGGGVVGTDDRLLVRTSIYQHNADGYRDNNFLGRDDTNNQKETTARSKLRWVGTPGVVVDLTLIHVDLNNGYDAFAIDNTFNTQSDRPGNDKQRSDAGALKFTVDVGDKVAFESISTLSDSDIDYSYDGDWGNNSFWGEYAPYDYFSQTYRDRNAFSQEVRFLSDDPYYLHGVNSRWVVGLFTQELDEDTTISQQSDDLEYDGLMSDYSASTSALFGQFELPIVRGTSLTLGLRNELRTSDYSDSKDSSFEPRDEMLGGNVSLNHDLSETVRGYILLSRGFKGGGFNANPFVPNTQKQYDPEYLWNAETGVKGSWMGGRLLGNFAVFYDYREDAQVKLAIQPDPTDPLSFLYLTDNAASGRNYGAEAEVASKLTDHLSVDLTSGLLYTEYLDYSYPGVDLSGRDQSHAPNWQYSVGPRYALTDKLSFVVRVTGKDSFYFDDSNNEKSSPYHLVNTSIEYAETNWSLSFWVRNLFDKEYAVRGFYFGNEPPDFPNKRYVQQGDPRQIGLTVRMSL